MSHKEYRFTVTDQAQTVELASRIAGQLRGGEIIELVGDLGAGKTTFVKGVAIGLESTEEVTSPTFTICNVYHGRLSVYHCDFYRLNSDGLIGQEIQDMYDKDSVIVLEWSENLDRALPYPALSVVLNQLEDINSREIVVQVPSELEYIAL